MRFVVASFLVLSNFCALNAEPLTPMPTQKYRLACNASQASVAQSCRARCDEAMYECLNRKCVGQPCAQQCGPTHTTCLQSCVKSAGC
jgi:hypothetical protein